MRLVLELRGMNYLKHYILLMRKAEKRGWTKKEQNDKAKTLF